MEVEVVFYEQRDLDEWKPRPRGLVAELQPDTTSPLGQLYADWSAANKRSIDEYDRRVEATRRYERKRGFYGEDETNRD